MLLLGCLLNLAHAANVTEIPPFLRGDVSVGYRFDMLSGSLEEHGAVDVEVGQRTISDHMLSYRAEFGAGPGVAVFFELPHWVSSTVGYGSLGTMVYDPATGAGTYQGTNPGEAGDRIQGSGLGGVWIGVRGTPFSEAFETRKNRATWLLEGALRTGDSSNLWTIAGESRGAGTGGTAFRLHSAFSTTFRSTQPWVSGTFVTEGKRTVDVYGDAGTLLASGIEVDPASTLELRTGVEVLAAENEAAGSQLSFDLHMGVAYGSWQTLPSGFYLPEVLDTSEGRAIQQAEQLEGGGGLAIYWRPMTYMQVDLYGDAAWHLPQRIEHPYPVYTGDDTFRVVAGSRLTVRIR